MSKSKGQKMAENVPVFCRCVRNKNYFSPNECVVLLKKPLREKAENEKAKGGK